MKITTASGHDYEVDRKQKLAVQISATGQRKPIKYAHLVEAFVGSTTAAFLDEDGNTILDLGVVTQIQGDPNAWVAAEQGNVLIRTQNSTYEVNQEQKLVRRLAGMNPATERNGLDGDWQPYFALHNLQVGYCCYIRYTEGGEATRTSPVREIVGTYVEPPVDSPAMDRMVDAAVTAAPLPPRDPPTK